MAKMRDFSAPGAVQVLSLQLVWVKQQPAGIKMTDSLLHDNRDPVLLKRRTSFLYAAKKGRVDHLGASHEDAMLSSQTCATNGEYASPGGLESNASRPRRRIFFVTQDILWFMVARLRLIMLRGNILSTQP